VMYLGRIVELTTREELYKNPHHPYTHALLGSIPSIGTGKKKMAKILTGEIPSPINPPSGCTFHPRCPYKQDRCVTERPELTGEIGHQAACHYKLNITKQKELSP
jgi:oligopeptide transport system ATP-binding protein